MAVPEVLRTGFDVGNNNIVMNEIKLTIFTATNLIYTEVLDMMEDYDVELGDAFKIVCSSGRFDQICAVVSNSLTEEDVPDEQTIQDLRDIREKAVDRYSMFKSHVEANGIEAVEVEFIHMFQDWEVAIFDYGDCVDNEEMRDLSDYEPSNLLAEKIFSVFSQYLS